MRDKLQISVAFTAILLVSAGPATPPEDLVRSANEAFTRGDLDEADSLYSQAEERSSDPGLVAFNKGTALYKRKDYRRAELSFRRSLGDADIPAERRTRALYNLGNCLVRQAGETDIKQLQNAIDCYDMVMRESSDEGLQQDAAHNLEMAKLLWVKARARRAPNENDPDWDQPRDRKDPPPDPKKPMEYPIDDGKGEGSKKLDPSMKTEPGVGKEKGVAPKEVPKAVPGQGSLPVLPDSDEVPDRSPEDARAYLKKTEMRLQRERQKLREEGTQGDRPRANDW